MRGGGGLNGVQLCNVNIYCYINLNSINISWIVQLKNKTLDYENKVGTSVIGLRNLRKFVRVYCDSDFPTVNAVEV